MQSFKQVFKYGLAVWLIPFVVAVLIFPVREADRVFFESIMPVVVAVSTVIFAVFYFRRIGKDFVKEGAIVGIVWFCMSVLIDLLLFSSGPMKMPLVDYVKDIGFTYLMIPAITLGIGAVLAGRRRD